MTVFNYPVYINISLVFNICRLLAEKYKHDRDYRAQLERSAHGLNDPMELSELNMEVEKSMVALRQKHTNDEDEAWTKFRR